MQLGRPTGLLSNFAMVALGTVLISVPVTGQSTDASSSVSIAAEVYGRAPYPLQSRGARLGYAFSDTREVLLTYLETKDEILLSDFSFRETELRFNQWLGPLAYFGFGAGTRDVRLEYNVFSGSATDAEGIQEHHQAVIIGAHFGFEFRLAGWLAVGSDIAGLTRPVHWLKHEDEYPEEAREFEEDPKELPYIKDGFRTCVQLARTYVALSF